MPFDGASLDLNLHARQGDAFLTRGTECLYGGAAGGGKSHLMRVASVVWCASIPGLQVYLFRRVRDDLVRNHMEGPKGYRAMLAGWVNSDLVKIVEDEIRFWTGSKIYLCHCKDENDIYKYQGAEMHVLLIDELTHFTEAMYRFLRNRVRMVGIVLPEAYAGMFPRVLAGANPGNIGHAWVKAFWIDDALPFEMRQMGDAEGGMLRVFIPAKLEDNPSMAKDDPGYAKRLEGLGSAALVKAMRHGSWDVIEGAFFDIWEARRHVVDPFPIPAHWMRFRSGDWGSAKPFSFGWWAVVSDDTRAGGLVLPRGCLIRYREWYGCQRTAEGKSIADTGLKMPAQTAGKRLAELEATDPVASYGVLDPATFATDGGPSIAERLMEGSDHQVIWGRADNKRVAGLGAMGGWSEMRARMIGDEDGNPMVVCFSSCRDSVRTIPLLQHDPGRPEDVLTSMEDHAADDWRYALNSRPWVKEAPKEPPKIDSWARAFDNDDGEDDSWRTA